MKIRWGNVIAEHPKSPEVKVSFRKDDPAVIEMVARWFGLSTKEFMKLVKEHKNEERDNSSTKET